MVKEYLIPIAIGAAGVIVGMIIYDMFVKNAIGANFEGGNYEVNTETGEMRIAA